MLQHNWDITKTAVLDYIVEITAKSIEICISLVLSDSLSDFLTVMI